MRKSYLTFAMENVYSQDKQTVHRLTGVIALANLRSIKTFRIQQQMILSQKRDL